MILADDVAEGVKPAAGVDEAARFIREPFFDSLLIFQGLLFVLEGTVIEALFVCEIRRHDAPTEMIAITDGTAFEFDGRKSNRSEPEATATSGSGD
jgi:hypothetical protein